MTVGPDRPAFASTTRQRLHPATPLVGTIQLAPMLVFFFFVAGRDQLRGTGVAGFGLGAAFVIAVLAAGAWSWLAWSRCTYWFDDDGDLRIQSGVLRLTERRVQVSRLQSVDVTQPLLARVFGLAELRPEVAGSRSGATRLAYLSESGAQALRAELLARASGIRYDTGLPAPEAPETVLVTVPPGVLLTSLVLHPNVLLLVVAIPAALVLVAVLGAFTAALPFVFLLATPVFLVGGQFARWFGFTMAESPDGLRLRFGLLSHRSQTVPPGRVQAVRVQQPVLWRRSGWVRVVVNVAGASGGEDAQNRPSMLLPVAPEPVARAVLARVLPGVDVLGIPVAPVPRSARWRAPLQRRRLATGADGRVFVARHGWLVPTWDAVPHARTQSVRVTQGPWQRRLSLASVHVDSTPGPVRIVAAHRAVTEARQLAEEQVGRAHQARAAAPPDRWLQG